MSEPIQTKCCSKCKKFKPLTEFNKDKSMKDGLRGYCKSCQKVYQGKYQKTEKGKVAIRKGVAKYQKTIKGKATQKRKYQTKQNVHPEQIKAKNAVNNAIQAGQLPRPDTLQCYYGVHPAQQYHHHKGYAPEHWLDVIPVCHICHCNLHK